MENIKIELEKEKKILVEKYGLFMEKQEQLAPFAARIFATLLIYKEKGITFEDLVDFLEASKSTISTNLKTLQNLELIEFFTKSGDRKKYYYLSPANFLARIDENLKMYKTEHQLATEVINFREKMNLIVKNQDDEFEASHESPYLDYLSNTISSIEQLRDGIQKKCSAFKQLTK